MRLPLTISQVRAPETAQPAPTGPAAVVAEEEGETRVLLAVRLKWAAAQEPAELPGSEAAGEVATRWLAQGLGATERLFSRPAAE